MGIQTFDIGLRSGMPIIFLHAFPLHSQMWRPQFDALQSTERLLAMDLRGLGGSTPSPAPYVLENLVDDLFEWMDGLEIAKATLCGLSMGGYVALRAVERAPNRIQGLILADTQSAADTNEAKLKRHKALKTLETEGVPSFAESFVDSMLAETHRKSNSAIRNQVLGMIESHSATSIASAVLALTSRTDTTAALSQITVPTLVLVGESDTATPPESAKRMHQAIPRSDFHVIAGAGHLSNLENPEAFNAHMMEFIRNRILQ